LKTKSRTESAQGRADAVTGCLIRRHAGGWADRWPLKALPSKFQIFLAGILRTVAIFNRPDNMTGDEIP
jgi:hypothetical protein